MNTRTDVISILLADDHRMLREGIKSLIDKEPDMKVTGEAQNGYELLEMAATLHPDIVIMDVSMPLLNGIEATRRLRSETPEVKVFALSMHSDRQYVKNMLAAGASGYVLKANAFEELTCAIRTVLTGTVYVSKEITEFILNDYAQQLTEKTSDPLSVREREVLKLLAEGSGTKEAAVTLSISATTVDTHRKHIMEKLGISSIAELTKYAIRRGITTLDP